MSATTTPARARCAPEPAAARRTRRTPATSPTPAAPVAASFGELQQSAGNRAVSALVRGHGGAALQRKCACAASGRTCQRCAKERMQRKRVDDSSLTAVPDIVDRVLSASGHALDPATRSFMEARFGHDFSTVRVHLDSRAAASAQAVNAHAYTVGRHVVFGGGQFSPSTTRGRELLAHELAHVVQQSYGIGPIGETDRSELEADRAASLVAHGGRAPALVAAAPPLARKPKKDLPPARLKVDHGSGVIVIAFDGATVVRITYDASAGKAAVQHMRDETGLEGVGVQTPPGSNSHASAEGQYNQLYTKGTLSLSATPDEGGEPGDFFVTVHAVQPSLAKEPPPKPKVTPAPQVKPPEAKQEAPPPDKTEKEPEKEPEKLPWKSADQIISEHTTANFLDEEALGAELLKYALSGDTAMVSATLTALGSTDRDDVARELLEKASEDDLAKLAETPEGRRLLARLKDEVTSGYLGDDEKAQSARIDQALVSQKDPTDLMNEIKTAPVFPFSGVGWTKLSSASIGATLLDNGKIRIRTHMKPEHYKYSKNVPTSAQLGYLELEPDAMVGLYLIDEGGTQVYVPAAQLLEVSNQEDTKLLMMSGEAVITGVTLGSGGGLLAGGEAAASATARGAVWTGRALTALKWGDRVATAAGVASTIINDHRGLIIERFGEDGKAFLADWQKVETVLQYYAIGRGAVALGQTGAALRLKLKDFKTRRAQMKLSAADESALDDMVREAEKTLDEIDAARATTGKGTGAAGAADDAPLGIDKRSLIDDVTEETKKAYRDNPKLKSALERNPRAAAALKKCKSPCFPDYATEDQIKKINDLIADAEAEGRALDQKKLAEYFRSGENRPDVKTIQQKQEALDDLIDGFADFQNRRNLGSAPHAGTHVEPDEFTGGEQRSRHPRTSEYDPTVGDSSQLAANLERGGAGGAGVRKKPGPGYQAHHIIPSNEGPQELRDLLKKHNLDINGEFNGSWLPTGSQTKNLGAEFKHEFVTSRDKYFYRLSKILDTKPPLSREQFLRKLTQIGDYLQNGKLPPTSL